MPDKFIRRFIFGRPALHGRHFVRCGPCHSFSTAVASAYAKPKSSTFEGKVMDSNTVDNLGGRKKPRKLSQAQREWLYDEGIRPVVELEEITDRPLRFDWRGRATSRLPNVSSDTLPYTRRKEPDDNLVTRRDLVGQIDTYKDHFMPLIEAEQEAADKIVTERLSTWTLERQKREGYCITGLYAFWMEEKYLGLPVAKFRLRPGSIKEKALPDHVFGIRSQILVSRLDPLKEEPYRGTLVKYTSYELEVSFEESFDVSDGVWRLDLGQSNTVFSRMRRAINYFKYEPSRLERSVENTDAREVILRGTDLRDILLRSFNPDAPSINEPHHIQDPEEPHYVGHEVLEHPNRLDIQGKGIFDDDCCIRSWAKRYQHRDPVVVEGDPDLKGLNATQIRAMALMIGERISLVQGPPGTGKTKTIVETIKLLKGHFEVPQPILVCTYTNVAVDNLLEGFVAADLKPLRVGFEGKPKPGLEPYLMDTQFENHKLKPEFDRVIERIGTNGEEIKDLEKRIQKTRESPQAHSPAMVERLKNMRARLRQLEAQRIALKARSRVLKQRILHDILMKADVICTTCIRSATYDLDVVDFPVVFLDEASMSTEPASLIPLMKGCKHLALIGDHKQLPPIVISPEAQVGGFDISLFERLTGEGDVPSIMLDTQYRMHPAISKFPSLEFYDLALLDGTVGHSGEVISSLLPPSSSHLIENSETGLSPSLIFIDHEGPEAMKNKSRVNWTEAYIICNVIGDLIRQNETLLGEDIGIIAPYKSQINLITRLLTKDPNARTHFNDTLGVERALEIPNIEIKTVDGFEGREKDVIVFSTVRNNASGHIGFLADRRRLNVGLTRAKRALFVIGNMNTLKRGKFGRSTSEDLGRMATISKGAAAWRNYAQYLSEQNLVLQMRGEKLQNVLKPFTTPETYFY